jgi:DNA-binding response OmpR family regulator
LGTFSATGHRRQDRDLVPVSERRGPRGSLSVHHERADGGDLLEPIAPPARDGVDDLADRSTLGLERTRVGELAKRREQPHPDHGRLGLSIVIAGQAYRRRCRPGIVAAMSFLVVLSDRVLQTVLPALDELQRDLKLEPLSAASLGHVLELDAEAIVLDAVENPGHAWSLAQQLHAGGGHVPVVVVAERDQLERYPWHEVADELVYPGAPVAELRARLAMLRRRAGSGGGAVTRLGPLAIDGDTYRVTAGGRSLDLTFKEFELLRFLASRPGRVFSRPALLREVWGYDFYGGTRTVDVHVRRLRAKLGPEHEHLIETVRSVGYRAAAPE